jgi:hypothetical protein
MSSKMASVSFLVIYKSINLLEVFYLFNTGFNELFDVLLGVAEQLFIFGLSFMQFTVACTAFLQHVP